MSDNNTPKFTFESLGIHSCFNFPEGVEIDYLGKGISSRAFRVGSYALKVGKSYGDLEDAVEYAAKLWSERDIMEPYLGENMPATSIIVAGDWQKSTKARLVTVQEYVPGVSLTELLQRNYFDIAQVKDFLERCLAMYEATGYIPDIATIESGFDIFKNRNFIIDTRSGDKPYLVDTDFGKYLRSRIFGPLLRNRVASGIQRGLKKL